MKAEISTPAAKVTIGKAGDVTITATTKLTLDAPVDRDQGAVGCSMRRAAAPRLVEASGAVLDQGRRREDQLTAETSSMPSLPRARQLDPTNHPGTMLATGSPNVLINGLPAARVGDMHVCALPPLAGPHPPNPIAQRQRDRVDRRPAGGAAGATRPAAARRSSAGSVDVLIGGDQWLASDDSARSRRRSSAAAWRFRSPSMRSRRDRAGRVRGRHPPGDPHHPRHRSGRAGDAAGLRRRTARAGRSSRSTRTRSRSRGTASSRR